MRLNIGFPTEITASYYYLKTHDVTDYGQPTISPIVTGDGTFHMPPISPRNYYGYEKYDHTMHETQIGTFRIDHRFNRNVTLRNVTRYAEYARETEATIPSLRATDINGQPIGPNTPIENLMVTRNHDGNRSRNNDDSAFVNQTDVSWKVSAGSIKHLVTGGLELAREKLTRWNFAIDADPGTPGNQTPNVATPLTNPDATTPLSFTKVPAVRSVAQGDTFGIYVQDQVEFSEQWKALAGLRWEHYASEARTESYATGVIATGPFERTDRMTSGRLGLIWQPTATQSYYVAAGNSFNPSGELGAYGSTGTNLSPGNASCRPRRTAATSWAPPGIFATGCSCARRSSATRRRTRAWWTSTAPSRSRAAGAWTESRSSSRGSSSPTGRSTAASRSCAARS